MEQSPSWEANRFSASQEIPAIYGTRNFITAVTSALHLYLFWASSIQSAPPLPTSWRYILPNLTSLFRCLDCTKVSLQVRGLLLDCTATWYFFYGEELLARSPKPMLEDYSLSAVRYCLFSISAAAIHSGGRSSIRNRSTRHTVVTGTRVQHSGYNII